MDSNELERLHDSGKIPDKFYFQLNNGSAQENYNRQRRNILKGYKKNQDFESYVFAMLQAMLVSLTKDLYATIKELNQG